MAEALGALDGRGAGGGRGVDREDAAVKGCRVITDLALITAIADVDGGAVVGDIEHLGPVQSRVIDVDGGEGDAGTRGTAIARLIGHPLYIDTILIIEITAGEQ